MNRLAILSLTLPLLVIGGSLPDNPAIGQDKGINQEQHAKPPGEQRGMTEMMGMMRQMSGMMENCHRMMESHDHQHPAAAPPEKKG